MIIILTNEDSGRLWKSLPNGTTCLARINRRDIERHLLFRNHAGLHSLNNPEYNWNEDFEIYDREEVDLTIQVDPKKV